MLCYFWELRKQSVASQSRHLLSSCQWEQPTAGGPGNHTLSQLGLQPPTATRFHSTGEVRHTHTHTHTNIYPIDRHCCLCLPSIHFFSQFPHGSPPPYCYFLHSRSLSSSSSQRARVSFLSSLTLSNLQLFFFYFFHLQLGFSSSSSSACGGVVVWRCCRISTGASS